MLASLTLGSCSSFCSAVLGKIGGTKHTGWSEGDRRKVKSSDVAKLPSAHLGSLAPILLVVYSCLLNSIGSNLNRTFCCNAVNDECDVVVAVKDIESLWLSEGGRVDKYSGFAKFGFLRLSFVAGYIGVKEKGR